LKIAVAARFLDKTENRECVSLRIPVGQTGSVRSWVGVDGISINVEERDTLLEEGNLRTGCGYLKFSARGATAFDGRVCIFKN